MIQIFSFIQQMVRKSSPPYKCSKIIPPSRESENFPFLAAQVVEKKTPFLLTKRPVVPEVLKRCHQYHPHIFTLSSCLQLLMRCSMDVINIAFIFVFLLISKCIFNYLWSFWLFMGCSKDIISISQILIIIINPYIIINIIMNPCAGDVQMAEGFPSKQHWPI